MQKYILNGFSTKMLMHKRKEYVLKFKFITKEEFEKNKKDAISAIGHKSLADKLGVPCNRFNIALEEGDVGYIITINSRRNNALDKAFHKIEYMKVVVE